VTLAVHPDARHPVARTPAILLVVLLDHLGAQVTCTP
jgi:hypothetical protein